MPINPAVPTTMRLPPYGSAVRDQIRSPMFRVADKLGNVEALSYDGLSSALSGPEEPPEAEYGSSVQTLTVRSREPVTNSPDDRMMSTALTSEPWQYRLAKRNSPVCEFQPCSDLSLPPKKGCQYLIVNRMRKHDIVMKTAPYNYIYLPEIR